MDDVMNFYIIVILRNLYIDEFWTLLWKVKNNETKIEEEQGHNEEPVAGGESTGEGLGCKAE